MLQHAAALEQDGHECYFYIEGSGTALQATESIKRLFGFDFRNVRYGWQEVAPADVAIATIWYSAAAVRDLPFPCLKLYFVQDFEAMFNPMGDAYLMAENSYRYGLIPVTIGRWLQHKLLHDFGTPAFHYDFGADHSVYSQSDSVRELAVCFIYQPDKPRRCSRIGIEALGIVKHRRPDVNIFLYGSPESDRGHIWFEHRHLGLLNVKQCADLYRRCAVGLCISSSNPSRIPFEMMAAGLPVVEIFRDNNLYDFPDAAVSLSDQSPESLAENILRLLEDGEERERMSSAGIAFMANRSLDDETSQFRSMVNRALLGERPSRESIKPIYARPPVVAGAWTSGLPRDIRERIARPSNAYLNSLPGPIRRVLAWGARRARRVLRTY